MFALVGASARQSDAQALQFRHLGVDDGLPGSLVSDIVRDRRGVMWIATARGVSRYDGHRFHTYAHDRADPNSLPGGVPGQVYEDRRGTLWVATPGGLSRYDAARDAFVTDLRSDAAVDRDTGRRAQPRVVTSVLDDARGTLWVGTSTGLYVFDRHTGVATPYRLAASATDGARAHPYVTALYQDRGSQVWVGTRAGLFALGGTPGAARHYTFDPSDGRSLPDTVVRALAEDAAGRLWVGTNNGGLARFDARDGNFARFRHDPARPHSLAKNCVIRLAADRSGTGLWVGTENGGLDYLEFATGRFLHHRFDPNVPSGIGSNSIWSIYQDATGVLWVGTFSGGLDISERLCHITVAAVASGVSTPSRPARARTPESVPRPPLPARGDRTRGPALPALRAELPRR